MTAALFCVSRVPPKSRYDTFVPELPEVETIVRELNRTVRGKVITGVGVETDAAKLVRPLTVAAFRRAVVGKRFLGFQRRAKFIIVSLGSSRRRVSRPPRAPRSAKSGAGSPVSGSLVWHMGMTGHPLYRDPRAEALNPKLAKAMTDPMNRHVRVTFHFADGTRLEYADVRKFGKIEFLSGANPADHPQLKKLGPDALALAQAPAALCARLRTKNTVVKVALLDQEVLAGVGNIYADEALWTARIHPLLPVQRLKPVHCRVLARALTDILRAAIRARGTSVDDFRRPAGTKGAYGEMLKAYRRTHLPCPRCGTLIQRCVVGGRGTHVCSRCQVVPAKHKDQNVQ